MTASTTLVAVVAIALSIAIVLTDPVTANTFADRSCLTFASKRQHGLQHVTKISVRGGATEVQSDDDEIEIESSDDEEELDPKLAKSTLTAASKRKAKAAGAVKAAVSSKLQETVTGREPSKKMSSKSILKLLKIPYIVRACLNPFILIRMTKGYFASLFNFNYLQEKKEPSQDLRSSLEAKAKTKKGGTGGPRGKRKMKPGQAKTLSDLPQLNT